MVGVDNFYYICIDVFILKNYLCKPCTMVGRNYFFSPSYNSFFWCSCFFVSLVGSMNVLLGHLTKRKSCLASILLVHVYEIICLNNLFYNLVYLQCLHFFLMVLASLSELQASWVNPEFFYLLECLLLLSTNP